MPNKHYGPEDVKYYLCNVGTGKFRECGRQRLSRSQMLRNWIREAQTRSWQDSRKIQSRLDELIAFAYKQLEQEEQIIRRIMAG